MIRQTVLLLACGLALAGCGRGRMSARGPDELAISRNAPLVVPQDFALAPPKPGSPRPAGIDAQAAAMEALFGPGVRPPPKSPVEQELLNKAGAGNTDPSIRSQAGDPDTTTVNKGAFLRELIDAPARTNNAKVASVTVPG